MHCDLAQFKPWSDAQMDISGIERVGSGGGREREEKRGQWKKNKMNYLIWNIIPGYIYSSSPENTLCLQ